MRFVLHASVAVLLCAYLAGAQTSTSGLVNDLPASLQSNPALAAFLNDTDTDPELLLPLLTSPLFAALAVDPGAVDKILGSQQLQSIASDPAALNSFLSSPDLQAVLNAPSSDASVIIADLLANAPTPSTGDPDEDAVLLEESLLRDLEFAPAPAPVPAPTDIVSSRKLLDIA